MSVTLPQPIADYFAADRSRDADAVAECFTGAAIVRDEGRSHIGHSAIRRWKADASVKFAYSVEPVAIESEGECVTVTGRVTGDFPGSPVDLRYRFAISGSLISALEIAS